MKAPPPLFAKYNHLKILVSEVDQNKSRKKTRLYLAIQSYMTLKLRPAVNTIVQLPFGVPMSYIEVYALINERRQELNMKAEVLIEKASRSTN